MEALYKRLTVNLSDNSKLLDEAVAQLSRLPGVGARTALRLALHLLREDEETSLALGNAIIDMRKGVRYCSHCHNISDTDTCAICADTRRDRSVVCVVENVKDVITIEETHEHHGVYHVLGGIISPLEGVSPNDLEIDSLVKRVEAGGIREVILALSATMEGDTTNYYIYRKLQHLPVKVTMLARGVSVGGELEYTDSLTLGRSLMNRIPFSDTIHS